jgi:hypothetical protein
MSAMFETIRRLRRATAESLAAALRPILDAHPSEVEIRDRFHAELSRTPDVTSEGWYSPPPGGLIVTVGSPPGFERLNQPSFRPAETWPSRDVQYTPESILYAYGSRVDTATGAIGDLACSLYMGTDARIHSHIRDVWEITIDLASSVELGAPISDVYRRCALLSEKAGYSNHVLSVTDPSRTNIGHTVPWTDTPLTPEESLVLRDGSPSAVADLVNGKRRFVSSVETLELSDNMLITVEPRLSRPGVPMVNFNVIAGFIDGKRVMLTDFDPLFNLFGMDLAP